jgi:hypothetical protein
MIVLQENGDLKLLVFQLDKEDGVCASEDVDKYSQRGWDLPTSLVGDFSVSVLLYISD